MHFTCNISLSYRDTKSVKEILILLLFFKAVNKINKAQKEREKYITVYIVKKKVFFKTIEIDAHPKYNLFMI